MKTIIFTGEVSIRISIVRKNVAVSSGATIGENPITGVNCLVNKDIHENCLTTEKLVRII